MRSHLLDRDELLARQAFQLALVDLFRPMAQPDDIMAAAAAALGAHLDVARCGYGEVSADGVVTQGVGDWSNGTLPGLAATPCVIETLGTGVIADLRGGRTVIVDDCATDDRADDPATARCWAEAGIGALIAAPLIRHGRLSAILYLHEATPRHWTQADIALVEDVALRTSDAVDRVRADIAVKTSEARYRSLFESIDAGFCVIEVLFADGVAHDYRFLEVNRAFARNTGLDDMIGRTMRDVAPDMEQRWFDLYGHVATTGEPLRFEPVMPCSSWRRRRSPRCRPAASSRPRTAAPASGGRAASCPRTRCGTGRGAAAPARPGAPSPRSRRAGRARSR